MIKKLFVLTTLLISTLGCAQSEETAFKKEALENVISVIEKDIFFATPHFAKQNGFNNEIIEELDNDYHNYSNEEALEAGVPYIKNSNSRLNIFFTTNIYLS